MPAAASRQRDRALLLDLFGTVIHFAPQVPTVDVAGTLRRTTMPWLHDAAGRVLPQIPFDEILRTLMEVTEEMVQQRPPEYREVPSRERFRRALGRLGLDGAHATAAAVELSTAHMAHLASLTVLPPEQPLVLQQLAGQYRLGLVSNFDHGATARHILARHGVTDFFDAIVISEEFGRRKPHPTIFAEALHRIGVGAAQALFVGDSIGDDVVGARNAGLGVVWINAKSEPLPPGAPLPDYVGARLADLPTLLP